MKKQEKLELLSSSIYAQDLFKANELFKKIKSSVKAVAGYRGADDARTEEIINMLGKVKLGSVVTRYASLMQKKNSLTLDEKAEKTFARLINGIEKELTNLFSLSEVLINQSIDALKAIFSSKVREEKTNEIFQRLSLTAENLIERTSVSPKKAEEKRGIETIFAKAEEFIKIQQKLQSEEVKEEATEAEKTSTDATESTETANVITSSTEQTGRGTEAQNEPQRESKQNSNTITQTEDDRVNAVA